MAANINVLLVVDTNATQNGKTTVYMMDDNAKDTQGSSELTINAQIGDTIFWNVASLIPTEVCILTSFVPTSGNLFNGGPSTNNGVWQGQIAKHGKETYHFDFTIAGDPTVYAWDPYINVP